MSVARYALLLAASLLVGGASCAQAAGPASSPANPATTSHEKLRQLTDQVRPQPTASQAGSQAVREAAAVSPARLQERAELLKIGETALARLQLDAALQAFERAALILHAADTEMALVRSYMQGGEYRRALAFGAHTAGAHLDVVGGSALYAWLLHVGGQAAIAQRLLLEAEARIPSDPMIKGVQQQLRAGAPLASGPLLAAPTRLAPYGSSQGVPAAARVVGSGLLLQGGKQALVPLALLPGTGNFWLRNGLGQLTKAQVDKRLPAVGLALLRLQTALPAAEDQWVAPSDAFPGSVGFAVEYVAAPGAAPAWPVLRTGFMGGPIGNSGERQLGIDMPAGPRGGPVFDASGRLIGLALQGKAGTPDLLVPASQLRKELHKARGDSVAAALGPAPPPGTDARASVDRIYEVSLKTSLQLIAVP